nr:unnamed protein product [Digitaria exilis]
MALQSQRLERAVHVGAGGQSQTWRPAPPTIIPPVDGAKPSTSQKQPHPHLAAPWPSRLLPLPRPTFPAPPPSSPDQIGEAPNPKRRSQIPSRALVPATRTAARELPRGPACP